ncbi:transglutaminase-like domain-containing protein [Marinomonas sp. PE14-40]|uniref:transglutaminase-like domain-containing protein n=1 Tax=Marinomonas sp. PE14-40 TaxID=3060621 RepID=UPI003F663150
MKETKYLQETELLDFNRSNIQALIEKRKWKTLPEKERIGQIYNYVRDEILFGYNEKDELSASEILQDGIGQCNTKSTLLMALLRAAGIPCRLHGFTINKALQKGAFTGIWYQVAPQNILHTWVEINYQDIWYNLEGVILDLTYLTKLQKKFESQRQNFCGYGVFTEDLLAPEITWNESDTYIQKLGINQDFGLFDSPDALYAKHQQDLSLFKAFIFKHFIRHSNNKNVNQIRHANI